MNHIAVWNTFRMIDAMLICYQEINVIELVDQYWLQNKNEFYEFEYCTSQYTGLH